MATFSTNLLLGVADLKVGASIAKNFASTSERVGMMIVWAKTKAGLDTPKGLLEGKNLKGAVSGTAVKMAASKPSAAGVELLKDALKATEMEPWAIPVEVASNIAQDRGADMLAKSGEKNAAAKPNGAISRLPHPHRNHHLMDSFLDDRSIIEQSAVRKIASGVQG